MSGSKTLFTKACSAPNKPCCRSQADCRKDGSVSFFKWCKRPPFDLGKKCCLSRPKRKGCSCKVHLKPSDVRQEVHILICVIKKGLKDLARHRMKPLCDGEPPPSCSAFVDLAAMLDKFAEEFDRVYPCSDIDDFAVLICKIKQIKFNFTDTLEKEYWRYKTRQQLVNCMLACFKSLESKLCSLMMDEAPPPPSQKCVSVSSTVPCEPKPCNTPLKKECFKVTDVTLKPCKPLNPNAGSCTVKKDSCVIIKGVSIKDPPVSNSCDNPLQVKPIVNEPCEAKKDMTCPPKDPCPEKEPCPIASADIPKKEPCKRIDTPKICVSVIDNDPCQSECDPTKCPPQGTGLKIEIPGNQMQNSKCNCKPTIIECNCVCTKKSQPNNCEAPCSKKPVDSCVRKPQLDTKRTLINDWKNLSKCLLDEVGCGEAKACSGSDPLLGCRKKTCPLKMKVVRMQLEYTKYSGQKSKIPREDSLVDASLPVADVYRQELCNGFAESKVLNTPNGKRLYFKVVVEGKGSVETGLTNLKGKAESIKGDCTKFVGNIERMLEMSRLWYQSAKDLYENMQF